MVEATSCGLNHYLPPTSGFFFKADLVCAAMTYPCENENGVAPPPAAPLGAIKAEPLVRNDD
jgi:hypothetical protein